MRLAPLVVLVASGLLAGCSGPGKVVDVHDVLLYAPASVSSDDPTLQVCVLPARRVAKVEDGPGGKTLLAVPLTRTDGKKGDTQYAAALGQPATFALRGPWFMTLGDGFLKVEVTKGDHKVRASVEGAQNPAPPPIVAEDELWLWIGKPPTKDDPDPRGTFVGVRIAKDGK